MEARALSGACSGAHCLAAMTEHGPPFGAVPDVVPMRRAVFLSDKGRGCIILAFTKAYHARPGQEGLGYGCSRGRQNPGGARPRRPVGCPLAGARADPGARRGPARRDPGLPAGHGCGRHFRPVPAVRLQSGGWSGPLHISFFQKYVVQYNSIPPSRRITLPCLPVAAPGDPATRGSECIFLMWKR